MLLLDKQMVSSNYCVFLISWEWGFRFRGSKILSFSFKSNNRLSKYDSMYRYDNNTTSLFNK